MRGPAAVGVALAVGLCGCGAFDTPAPRPEEAARCPTLDQRAAGLLSLVHDGRLPGLEKAMTQSVAPDLRSRLVDVLLDVAGALPEDAFEKLLPGLKPATGGGLEQTVAALLGAVEESGDAGYAAFDVVGALLQECTGKPLMAVLDALLGDPTVVADLEALLGALDDVDRLLVGLGVDLRDPGTREAFLVLGRVILTSVSVPGFSTKDLEFVIGLLGSSADNRAIGPLADLLRALLAPGAPLDAVQPVTRCLLERDPDARVLALVFDLLARIPMTATTVDIEPVMEALGHPVLRFLVADDDARGSLVTVLAAMASPAVAELVVPDLRTLIDAGGLREIMDVLAALAGGGCP